ncbi:scamp family-domain-containing protein [Thamnidium elegans]|nr:scamp family-domain-containing protein [Thamnidium elegans]
MSHQPLPTSPFEDPSNPFQDPSITSALNSERAVHESSHDDTTFHHVSDNRDPFGSSTTYFNNDNNNTPSPPLAPATDNFLAREEALRQKERELADRERNLEERQRNGGLRGANNFPPCFPIMYLNIVQEIPTQHQSTVLWLYREWLLFLVTLLLNFFACLWVLIDHPTEVQTSSVNMGIALTELFTHTLASFFLWYRPVYNAYMKDTSLYYYFFFVFNGFHILYTFYMAIGIPSTGGAGLILLITLFQNKFYGGGVITLLATICWLVMGCLAVYLYKKTYDHYKAAGHTFKEAKSEAFSHMGRSNVVRDTAVNVAWNSARR